MVVVGQVSSPMVDEDVFFSVRCGRAERWGFGVRSCPMVKVFRFARGVLDAVI